MLIRKWDAALDDEEWREYLVTHDFGQFIAPGRDRALPVIVPTHFVFDGESTILLHLAKSNPVWEALDENPLAVMSVAAPYVYIPTQVNGGRDEPAQYGVPTSYYAAVQASGPCEIFDGDALAPILVAQLEHFQREGGYAAVEPGDNPYARQFAAIRGIRLTVEEVRAKFKFGGNKSVEHRRQISAWLADQGTNAADEARSMQVGRTKQTTGEDIG